MSTTFLYALILAIGQIVLTLVGFFLGYQTDNIANGTWYSFTPLLLSITVLFLGMRAVREEDGGGYLTYAKGVGTGLMISLYAGLMGAVYTYIHFTFVSPSFADYLIEATRTKWAAAGMSDTQMDGAEKGMRMFMKPAIQSVFGVVLSVVAGLVISLIGAAILKRNPPDDDEVVA